MLTKVQAYSSWSGAPTLTLSDSGRIETDLIQIRNIEGLDPVKASINTSPLGYVDGASYTGGSVLSRNIVLTLRPNPDWDTWTHASLRKLLYLYFMPKKPTTLIFYSDDMDPVKITGIVEDVQENMFSKDIEFNVSIICPDPYFTALNPTYFESNSTLGVQTIDYKGSVETGINLKAFWTEFYPTSAQISVEIGDPVTSFFSVFSTLSSNVRYFELNTVHGNKFVRDVTISTGITKNLLGVITAQEGTLWPALQPGENKLNVGIDLGNVDYQLKYYERFGGL